MRIGRVQGDRGQPACAVRIRQSPSPRNNTVLLRRPLRRRIVPIRRGHASIQGGIDDTRHACGPGRHGSNPCRSRRTPPAIDCTYFGNRSWHLGSELPVGASGRLCDVVEGLDLRIDRQLVDLEQPADTSADRDRPAVAEIGQPVRGDDRRRRQIPAVRQVVVDEGLEQIGSRSRGGWRPRRTKRCWQGRRDPVALHRQGDESGHRVLALREVLSVPVGTEVGPMPR